VKSAYSTQLRSVIVIAAESLNWRIGLGAGKIRELFDEAIHVMIKNEANRRNG